MKSCTYTLEEIALIYILLIRCKLCHQLTIYELETKKF